MIITAIITIMMMTIIANDKNNVKIDDDKSHGNKNIFALIMIKVSNDNSKINNDDVT